MPKRSKFSLSHYRLFSCDLGELVPISLVEVLGGDTFQHGTSILLRASPLLAPVMHPVHVRIHHFFVPHRLVWSDFEDFITGGPDGNNQSEFPTISSGAGGFTLGTLADYLGVPPDVPNLAVSALPFRVYNLVWNEWFRDQDLQDPLAISTESGVDTTTATVLQNCAWEKDYFTSSRPWEQKGPTITIPLGSDAPVVFEETGATAQELTLKRGGSGDSANVQVDQTGTTGAPVEAFADLSSATGISVNDLRELLGMQRFEEARARYGSRYVEYLRYYGVRARDARLQRPEYLGGGSNTIQFSEVLQTAEGTDPVGELRGHGIAGVRSRRYRRYMEEHGYIISLMSVRPKTIYMQGLERSWNRRTKEDFFQKELEHIGQQEVLNKEIYAPSGDPDGVFGFQDRYDEYRRHWSNVAGEFRTSQLNYWHMAREFSVAPALNNDFVECIPTERTFAVPSEDVLWVMARHSIQARRNLSKRAKPFIM